MKVMSQMRALLNLAVAVLIALPAFAAIERPLIVTTQDHSLVDADDCDNFHTQNQTSLPSLAQSEEERRVGLAGINLLKVRTGNEGGVSIKGWDRPFARLTVCKTAVALSDVQARSTLRQINVAITNGEIVANGPALDETQTWWVHMILRVPRKANVDITSLNGGIAVRNMNGSVTARARNGGISLAGCAGVNNIRTENGGISLDKITGQINATTQNGPISLKLRDDATPSIDAQTDDTGEILCHLKTCAAGNGNWTADRKHLRIGSSPSIRLTSYNADIMIEHVR